MNRSYQSVDRSNREEWSQMLQQNGQFLLPTLKLIEEAKMAGDSVPAPGDDQTD